MEHSKHIWRAVAILVILTVLFIVGRHFMIPESFGKTGHYRHDSIGEFMALPAVHGGRESCAKCHESQYATVMKGKHAKVSCEVCHAPLTQHIQDDEKIADMPATPSFRLCAYCHGKLDARPEGFPQVEFRSHLEEKDYPVEDEMPEGACLECHEVHSPAD